MKRKIQFRLFILTAAVAFGSLVLSCAAQAQTAGKANGQTCIQNSECQSSYCAVGICSTLNNAASPGRVNLPNGALCNGDSTLCQSGYCPNGMCETLPAGSAASGAQGPGNIIVPGTSAPDLGSGIIKCGRSGQAMCKLCDLVVGINTIIQYGFMLAVIVALTFIVVGAVIYIVSAGQPGTMEMAKGAMKNAAIGILVVFCAWLIINTSLRVIGAKTDLGIQVAGWNSFTCR